MTTRDGKLEASVRQVQSATTLDELTEAIVALRDLFRVEHLIYHSVNGVGGQYAVLTYDQAWVDRYVELDYARVDPVVLGCFRRFRPVNWKELDWSSRAARAFLEDSMAHGVGNQGYSVPIRGPNGQFALFTVNQSCSDAEWEKYTNRHMSNVILMAHYINQKALEIERGSDLTPGQRLSPREIDALTMLAAGMNRAQAAEALAISEHTLRVYVEGARFKLGASNTTHAVARALTMGLVVV